MTAHSSQASAPSEGGGNADTEVRASLSDGTVTSEDLPPALPELPDPAYGVYDDWYEGTSVIECPTPRWAEIELYSAAQMREYATAATLAERERCARICDQLAELDGLESRATECAEDIRALASIPKE